ncbi:PAS domain S-box-containing protein [Microlunatus sagamiharensis]|uniref:histidine kinase n=1 Tax=Microlunatus sagamiharensis TaxID=546874 RepID=A0A1H2LSL5_9ACTN|nr:ATP-binding protein [Microlunatus sagamiharensis]SDU83854.1 PAS domain S-box-containing protein [Microlunatus sagamiharensis]
MEGQLDAHVRAARRLRLTGLAVALVLAVLVVVLASDLPHRVRQTVTLTTLAGCGLVAALGFRPRVLAHRGRRRRAYLLFVAACLLASLSNLLQLLLPRATAPGRVMPGDLVLTLALAVAVAGLVQFPSSRRRTTDLTRMVLDGIVIGGSILLVADVTLFPDLLVDNPGGWPLLVVPVTDVVLATLATLLHLRSRRDHLMLGLVAASFYCFAASDFAFAFVAASGRQFSYGSLVDAGWLSGYLLLVLAIWAPSLRLPEPEASTRERSPLLSTAVLFTLFLIGLGVTLAAFGADRVSPSAVVLLLLVVIAVLARQSLLGLDNDRLRRQLEERVAERTRSLRQITARTDLLVDSVGEGIYGVDPDGMITFVNPATSRALGYAAADLIGRDAHATFHERAPDGGLMPKDQCYIIEAVREGLVSTAEADSYVCADGRMLPVEVTTTPLTEEDAVVGAVVIFRDVTQRREVDRLKSEFVSMVSHELRTPLTAIQGSLGLISGGALGRLPPAAGRMLEIASISAHRLNRLVDDILDIERIESGVLVLQPGRQQARDVVSAAVEQMQVLATEADVEVSVGPLEGAVHADPDRAVQTLINLIGNALKFSYPGGLVSVDARTHDDVVEFRVADQGRGIPEDRLERIFNRFEQVDSSDAREQGGFGLGLAISRSLVERSGGRIWATNNAERGATLHFTLPRSDDRPHPASARPATEPAVTGA